MFTHLRTFLLIIFLTVVAGLIAMPPIVPIQFSAFGRDFNYTLPGPKFNFTFLGRPISHEFELKQGLDIQGGMQVVLQADMSQIPVTERTKALEAARAIMLRRVDLFGVNEPVVQTSQVDDQYRLIVELAGVEDPNQALQLVGTTAELDFRLEASTSSEATASAIAYLSSFQTSGLTGKELKSAEVQFDPQTNEPVIALSFNDQGRELFAEITKANVGKVLAIFIDGFPVAMPVINTPILDGQAIMTGGFGLEDAKQLAIQLQAGALPVPVEVLEQRTIGASLGQESVQRSIRAGAIGIGLVMLFMILYYGWQGFLASLALCVYAVLTIAIYKILGVTLTLPGIAGLLLSIGMAVDSNILIFERMKEELRMGRSFERAMELGFGRAWDSIKDANLATIMTAMILINPLDLQFLNTSGLVRGFGITLLIGVLVSLFTGIVVTRTLMRLFLKG
ncbi:MAG TPA: protein translocase subunit SecD [Vitreimonas sp.]|nr:protein translocase subunit SecD [Vitreimonas sp.]